MTPSHPELRAYPVIVSLPVQWGEMDAYGHVNNTVFFRYFETARIAFLDQCGFLACYERDKIGAILLTTDCRFRRPLVYPDTVLVGGCAKQVAEDRFTMGYRLVSLAQDAIAAEGSGVIVSYDYKTGAKTTLPDGVRARIAEMHDA
ncbi:MAG TPA: thioesterase family protein [Gemmatimonadales bacterium]